MSIELEPETLLHPQPTSTSNPTQAPILSTPETHLFEDPTTVNTLQQAREIYTDAQIRDVYEIERTAREVVRGGWMRVALQFPDFMLRDAVRVFESLEVEVEGQKIDAMRMEDGGQSTGTKGENGPAKRDPVEGLETDFGALGVQASLSAGARSNELEGETQGRIRLFILADTSYNSCCVDEIAAEHCDADVVVHYGRSCLSPTKTLPVIYVFTSHPLDLDAVVEGFEEIYSSKKNIVSIEQREVPSEGKNQGIILMADITYDSHIEPLAERLRARGWSNIIIPKIVHNPDAIIPNRQLPDEIGAEELKSFKLFHISDPPNALLMILYSRVGQFVVYPTDSSTTTSSATKPQIQDNTKQLLNRRYALLTHLHTQPILGILINTLSHSSTTSILSSLTALLHQHGKKYYTFVVGKVNAAKMANFSEIGGWVVVGCWEGGLFDEGAYWRGTVTPFELELALKGEAWRIRGGEWRAGGLEESIANDSQEVAEVHETKDVDDTSNQQQTQTQNTSDPVKEEDEDSQEESEPPEYDFRTGRYITASHAKASSKSDSKPSNLGSASQTEQTTSNSLTRRSKNTEVASINGVLSPGAEYLRSQRTWQGLGSDFVIGDEEGTSELAGTIEEGRSGVARGYVVGDGERH